MSIIPWITLGASAVTVVLMIATVFYTLKASYYWWIADQCYAQLARVRQGLPSEPIEKSIRAFLFRRGGIAK